MEENSGKDIKKKVSFMGRNFDPVTSHFYKKKKLSAREPIVFGGSENGNNYVIIYGPIDGVDWGSDRIDDDDSEDLTKLDDLEP